MINTFANEPASRCCFKLVELYLSIIERHIQGINKQGFQCKSLATLTHLITFIIPGI